MGNHGAVISMHKMCIKYYICMCVHVYVHIMSLKSILNIPGNPCKHQKVMRLIVFLLKHIEYCNI